ncbi:MAG: hypothetical protein JW772_01675 [Candidatus Diapherotrites archaeon]|nr:hypothetical protein [Candidatus Diapherotrites archaeon]
MAKRREPRRKLGLHHRAGTAKMRQLRRSSKRHSGAVKTKIKESMAVRKNALAAGRVAEQWLGMRENIVKSAVRQGQDPVEARKRVTETIELAQRAVQEGRNRAKAIVKESVHESRAARRDRWRSNRLRRAVSESVADENPKVSRRGTAGQDWPTVKGKRPDLDAGKLKRKKPLE